MPIKKGGETYSLQIPENGPILGRHLDIFRRIMGATVSDTCAALGIHVMMRWYQLRKDPDLSNSPVDRPIAILVWYYLSFRQEFPFNRIDMEVIQKLHKLSDEDLGYLVGRKKLAVQQWKKTNSLPDRSVVKVARLLADAKPGSDKYRALKQFADRAWSTNSPETAARHIKRSAARSRLPKKTREKNRASAG